MPAPPPVPSHFSVHLWFELHAGDFSCTLHTPAFVDLSLVLDVGTSASVGRAVRMLLHGGIHFMSRKLPLSFSNVDDAPGAATRPVGHGPLTHLTLNHAPQRTCPVTHAPYDLYHAPCNVDHAPCDLYHVSIKHHARDQAPCTWCRPLPRTMHAPCDLYHTPRNVDHAPPVRPRHDTPVTHHPDLDRALAPRP